MSNWLFPISPVAASRPRVSRHGAYFAGPYKKFRTEMADLVPTVLGDFEPVICPLAVSLEFFIAQPKQTKLAAPKADIDNYIKSVLDSLNGFIWEDDFQIWSVYAIKQWAPKGEDGYFTVEISECSII